MKQTLCKLCYDITLAYEKEQKNKSDSASKSVVPLIVIDDESRKFPAACNDVDADSDFERTPKKIKTSFKRERVYIEVEDNDFVE